MTSLHPVHKSDVIVSAYLYLATCPHKESKCPRERGFQITVCLKKNHQSDKLAIWLMALIKTLNMHGGY